MKKKVLLTVIFAFILMVAGYTISNAATYETDTYKVNIPDKYKVEIKDNDEIFVSAQYINNNDIFTMKIARTKEDAPILVNQHNLEVMKAFYRDDIGANFYLLSSGFRDINNCKGMEITFRNILASRFVYGNYHMYCSDNYAYDVMFLSTSRSYLTSAEMNSILKSFKVKDTVSFTNGIPFMDVGRNDWYYDSVKSVSNDGVIAGTTDYTYNPSGKLTRGQLATILWRMAGMPKVKGKEFPDVKTTDYYYQAIQWASANKIVNGYATGKFGPKDNVTREQLAVMLQNYAKYKKINVSKVADISKYKDVKGVSSYATNAVAWAIQNKIISGKENGTRIDPKGNASRAEAAAMIQNYRTYVK